MPDTENGFFLIRERESDGREEVWTGCGWAAVPRNSTDDQRLAVGGIRIGAKEAERISSMDSGKNITMIPVHDWN
jgi:hypothetical protein